MVKRLTNPAADRPPPLGNLLAAASRTLAAELDAGLAAAGFPDLRAAHAPLFQVIEPEGSRQTDLAVRLGMTKQAVGELVRHLVRQGYVEVRPDADDGRARVVVLTQQGWNVIDAGLAVVTEFDRRLDEAIGAPEVVRLRRTLLAIIDGVGTSHLRDHREPTDVMKT